jgi:hypothetical protein
MMEKGVCAPSVSHPRSNRTGNKQNVDICRGRKIGPDRGLEGVYHMAPMTMDSLVLISDKAQILRYHRPSR